MDTDFIQRALISLPMFMLALTIHEFSHGYAAYRLGDKTALHAGRLTFNPIKHLDPIGVVVFVISQFRFGWAKPVPVDLRHTKNPKMAMLITAAAGPASNIVQATFFGIIFRLNLFPATSTGDISYIINSFLFYGVFINCILAFFNMIPLPPLDGSKILFGILPRNMEHFAVQLERIGPILLILLIGSGFLFGHSIIWTVIGPFVNLGMLVFTGQRIM